MFLLDQCVLLLLMMAYMCLWFFMFCCTTLVHGYYECWEKNITERKPKEVGYDKGSACFFAFRYSPVKDNDGMEGIYWKDLIYSVAGKPGFGPNKCDSPGPNWGWTRAYTCSVVSTSDKKYPWYMRGMTYCCCFKAAQVKDYYCNDPTKANVTWSYWILGPQTKKTTTTTTTTHKPTGIRRCLEGNVSRTCQISGYDGNYPNECYNKFKVEKRDVYNAKMIESGCDYKMYCNTNNIATGKCDMGSDENGHGTMICCCDDYVNCNVPSLRPAHPTMKGMKSCLEGIKVFECPVLGKFGQNYPNNCYNEFNNNTYNKVSAGCDIEDYCGRNDIGENMCDIGHVSNDKGKIFCCCNDHDNCNQIWLKPQPLLKLEADGIRSCLEGDRAHACIIKDRNYPKNCYNEFKIVDNKNEMITGGCDNENYCAKFHIVDGKCGKVKNDEKRIICCCDKYANCNKPSLKPKQLSIGGMKSCREGIELRQCTLSHGNYPKNCYNEFNKDDYNKEIVSAGCDKMGYCVKYHIPEGKCAQGKDEDGKMMIFCCCNQYDNCNDAYFKPKTPTPTGMKSCLEDSKVHECRLIKGNYPKSCYNEFSKLDYNKRILSAGCDKEDHCGRNHITEGKCGPGKTKPDEGKIFCCCNHFENCNKPAFIPKIPTPTGMKSCLKGNELRQCTLSHGNHPKNCYNEFNKDDYSKEIVSAGCDKMGYCDKYHIPEGKCAQGKNEDGKMMIFCCCNQYDNCNDASFKPKTPTPTGMKSCLEGIKERQCTLNKGDYPKNCYNEFNNDTYNKELISAGCDIEDYCGRNDIAEGKCGSGKVKPDKGKIFCCCNQFENCNKPAFKPKIPTHTGMSSCLEGNQVRQCLLHAGNYPQNCYNEFNKDDYNKEMVSAGCDKMGYCVKYHIPEGKCAQGKNEDGKMMIFCCCNQYDNCNDASFKPKTPTPTGMKSCLEGNEVHECIVNKGNYPNNCYNEFNDDVMISAGCDTEDLCGKYRIPDGKCGPENVTLDKGKICCCAKLDNCNDQTLRPKIPTRKGMKSCLEGNELRQCTLSHGNYPKNCYNGFSYAHNKEIVSAGCDKMGYCSKYHIPEGKCAQGKDDYGKTMIFCCCNRDDNCNDPSFMPKPSNVTGVQSCLKDYKEFQCSLINETNYPKNCFNEFVNDSIMVSSGCDTEDYCGRNHVPDGKCGPGKIPQNEGKTLCCCDAYSDCNGISLRPEPPNVTSSTVNWTVTSPSTIITTSSAKVWKMSLLWIMLSILMTLWEQNK